MRKVTRRQFSFGASALLTRAATAAAEAPSLLATPAQARRIREALSNDAAFQAAADQLKQNAAAALKAGPWSVTSHRPEHVSAGPNDYFSEGPYWWPDPKNPQGPYIRKDGQRNPERFMGNRTDLGSLCTAVLALGAGACLLGDARCAEHASRVLSVWFVDPKTRMNPNLEYGQAVRGHNTGRGTGIIDTVSMIHTAQGVALLEMDGRMDAKVVDGVRQWFADYLKWMTTSEKGLDEKKSGNNHSTWWTAQVAAYAALTGNRAEQTMAWDYYRNSLVPTQVQPDGSCPKEEAREDSLSYSSMNLDGFSTLCRMAETAGVNLWRYRTPKGLAIETAFRYLLPYVTHPETWKKPQLNRYSADAVVFPGLAGAGLGSPELLAAFRGAAAAKSPWAAWVNLVVRTA